MINYNHTRALLFNVTAIKVVLLNDNAVLDVTHTTLEEVTGSGAWEVYYASEWPQGGASISNLVNQTTDTDKGILTGDSILFVPSTDIGPFRYAVAINQDDKPLGYTTFDTNKYFPQGYSTGISLKDGFLFKIQ